MRVSESDSERVGVRGVGDVYSVAKRLYFSRTVVFVILS